VKEFTMTNKIVALVAVIAIIIGVSMISFFLYLGDCRPSVGMSEKALIRICKEPVTQLTTYKPNGSSMTEYQFETGGIAFVKNDKVIRVVKTPSPTTP
jgi:hypothetical protein